MVKHFLYSCIAALLVVSSANAQEKTEIGEFKYQDWLNSEAGQKGLREILADEKKQKAAERENKDQINKLMSDYDLRKEEVKAMSREFAAKILTDQHFGRRGQPMMPRSYFDWYKRAFDEDFRSHGKEPPDIEKLLGAYIIEDEPLLPDGTATSKQGILDDIRNKILYIRQMELSDIAPGCGVKQTPPKDAPGPPPEHMRSQEPEIKECDENLAQYQQSLDNFKKMYVEMDVDAFIDQLSLMPNPQIYNNLLHDMLEMTKKTAQPN